MDIVETRKKRIQGLEKKNRREKKKNKTYNQYQREKKRHRRGGKISPAINSRERQEEI